MTTTTPRSISEAKRTAKPLNKASKAARDAMRADPTDAVMQAFWDAHRKASKAQVVAWRMKRRRHGVRTRYQCRWDRHYFGPERARKGAKATEARKAERAARREAERAARVEREASDRLARGEMESWLSWSAWAEREAQTYSAEQEQEGAVDAEVRS